VQRPCVDSHMLSARLIVTPSATITSRNSAFAPIDTVYTRQLVSNQRKRSERAEGWAGHGGTANRDSCHRQTDGEMRSARCLKDLRQRPCGPKSPETQFEPGRLWKTVGVGITPNVFNTSKINPMPQPITIPDRNLFGEIECGKVDLHRRSQMLPNLNGAAAHLSGWPQLSAISVTFDPNIDVCQIAIDKRFR